MFVQICQLADIDAADVRKEGGGLTIWVRVGPTSLSMEPEDAKWLIGALQVCVAEAEAAPADVAEGEIIQVRSPKHWNGAGIKRAQAEAAAPNLACRHDFAECGVCPKCGAHEDNEIAGPNGKHSAFNDPPD